MRSNQPPAFAHWLLTHFGSSPNNDAVIGDLNERYRERRSGVWYWKEVIVAIVVSLCKEVWRHPLPAVRAVLIGWLVKGICLFAYTRTYGFPDKRIFFDGSEVPLIAAMIAVIAMMCSGWIVARTSRPQARAMVLLYVVIELAAVVLNLRGVFLPYSSWTTPLTRLVAAVFFHFRMFPGAIPVMPISAGITVMSILIGAGFFSRREGPREFRFRLHSRDS
jgi:hypothetical protein